MKINKINRKQIEFEATSSHTHTTTTTQYMTQYIFTMKITRQIILRKKRAMTENSTNKNKLKEKKKQQKMQQCLTFSQSNLHNSNFKEKTKGAGGFQWGTAMKLHKNTCNA